MLELKRKCFVARLPRDLTPPQLAAVNSWASENCAVHRLYPDGDAIVLAAMRERPRSSKMHCRLLRAALSHLPAHVSIPTAGKPWLRILDEGEEFDECLRLSKTSKAGQAVGISADEEDRVVELASAAATRARPCLDVQKRSAALPGASTHAPTAPANGAGAEAVAARQARWALAEQLCRQAHHR
jgi:hypothetical protein